MKLTLTAAFAALMLCLPMLAEDKTPPAPEKVSDADRASYREAQLLIAQAQANRAQALALFYEADQSLKAATEASNKAIAQIQNGKCAGCRIDPALMIWVRPAVEPETKKEK